MRIAAIIAVVLLLPGVAMGSGPISLRFTIDRRPVPCASQVELRLAGRIIAAERTEHGFSAPAAFDKKSSEWSPDEWVEVTVACGGYRLTFPKIPPGWVRPGNWEVGIAFPPYWVEKFGYLKAVENGAWLSYLEFECDGCDPGVFTTVSHSTPPKSLVAKLRREQGASSGQRARDIAYALAVFKDNYIRNRDYLLESLKVCLARPKDSAEDDVCDGMLLNYLTNLYWRGDYLLLQPLLESADSRKDVINDIGTFYAHLLDRRTTAAINRLRALSPERQHLICELAGEDEYSMNEPELERVARQLHAIGDETANRCQQVSERAANQVPWGQGVK